MSGHATLGPRNLPRSSHACQRCREKKAKCNQQQPCSTCIRHTSNCIYGVKRKVRPRREGDCTQDRNPEEARDREMTYDIRDSNPPEGTAPNGTPNSLPASSNDLAHTNSNTVVDFEDQAHLIQEQEQEQEPDVVGDVNQHTQGTEFYGTSSNYVLLNQLFSFAQLHANAGNQHQPAPSSLSTTGQVSIINLLSNEEVLLPPSRPKTPPRPFGGRDHRHAVGSAHHRSRSSNSTISLCTAERRVEKQLVRSFMHNLHYIHPILDVTELTARCERNIWDNDGLPERTKESRHFFALYNIVVAVGALVSGFIVLEHLVREMKVLEAKWHDNSRPSNKFSPQMLSRLYFRKSRTLLDDPFEACSLESFQTLSLMSLYCQNALKPHACYMYCGMAVRTALAIGLPNESMSRSLEDRKAARRTWWCIYSHEIDMCCSSGRRDSLGKPHNYQLSFPQINEKSELDTSEPASESENHSVSMINEMVHLAVLWRRISKRIYHDSKRSTMLQKSDIAMELDILLDEWKRNLPQHLNIDLVSFREAEWAAKQKLVLRLRYLNARILIHRPFLTQHSNGALSKAQNHVDRCLDAARETIRVLYDSYANRHYFRTWWYNSTYALHAGTIVLYVVMLGCTQISSKELLEDVKKCRDILHSMEEATVAHRSASLISEVLEVVQTVINQRQDSGNQESEIQSQTKLHLDDGLSWTLGSNSIPDQDPQALLACLIDLNTLQDFTAESNNLGGMGFPMYEDFGTTDHSNSMDNENF